MAQVAQKPRIGVVAHSHDEAKATAEAIERSGGDPWVTLPGHGPSPEETLSDIGGLAVCGEDPFPPPHSPSPGSDSVLPLLEGALERDMPVLGLCRGMQALNLASGGGSPERLDGHASVQNGGARASCYHRIFIAPGSKLAAVVGSGGFVRVNSRHHHGLREAQKSPLLMASAYSLEDGVIEALESPAHRWVIGVQFHPELRREIPPHFDRLFQSFVERAQEHIKSS